MLLYLLDMQTAIQRILDYTKDLDYDGFANNFKVVDAVIRNFEILGEAAKNISPQIREEYPTVPWKKCMR
ncbi:hypothetical protein MATR_01660 [Marivirga tractuosa]|nr:hypothetical protein MATR_01660 [Marivirga tractuosa]